jgi:hypothetical protein
MAAACVALTGRPRSQTRCGNLWDTLNAVFPREREDRLKELVAVAYDASKPVGACTTRHRI